MNESKSIDIYYTYLWFCFFPIPISSSCTMLTSKICNLLARSLPSVEGRSLRAMNAATPVLRRKSTAWHRGVTFIKTGWRVCEISWNMMCIGFFFQVLWTIHDSQKLTYESYEYCIVCESLYIDIPCIFGDAVEQPYEVLEASGAVGRGYATGGVYLWETFHHGNTHIFLVCVNQCKSSTKWLKCSIPIGSMYGIYLLTFGVYWW